MKKINQKSLVVNKFSVPIPLEKELFINKDYTVAMFVTMGSIEFVDNNDDTKDVLYKGKVLGNVVIKDEFDKLYVKTKRGSSSQVFRTEITKWNDTDYEGKVFYTKLMQVLIDNPDKVVELAKELNGGSL